MALGFSWLYKLTPEGVKGEQAVTADASSHHMARRLNLLTIAAATLALLVATVSAIRRKTPARAINPQAFAIQCVVGKSHEGNP